MKPSDLESLSPLEAAARALEWASNIIAPFKIYDAQIAINAKATELHEEHIRN